MEACVSKTWPATTGHLPSSAGLANSPGAESAHLLSVDSPLAFPGPQSPSDLSLHLCSPDTEAKPDHVYPALWLAVVGFLPAAVFTSIPNLPAPSTVNHKAVE